MIEYHYHFQIGGLPVETVTLDDPLHFAGLWGDPMNLNVVRVLHTEEIEIP